MPWRDELLRRFPLLRKLPPRGVYAVGGAIRDLILGLDPADADIACADALACAQGLGRKVITLGRDHLSAYRIVDGDHIYDFTPLLGGSIDRDLGRRDFTINAMGVDMESGELLDPFDGRGDLERRLVRMVDAKNFDDDPLRMLKAVRMAVRFDFALDDATRDAIRARAASVTSVAAERIGTELTMIFESGRFRRALELLAETGLDVPLFGVPLDASRYHAHDLPPAAAYALLLRDARTAAERFRLSDLLLRDITTLQRLVDEHSLFALYDAGERVARQLPPLLRALGRDGDVAMPDFTTTSLLTGDEIASLLGERPGPRIGQLKRALLEAQLRGDVQTREEALQFIPSTARDLEGKGLGNDE
jgi:tRNA nucleotidyltransferase/poly(A) polymerase